MTGESGVDEDQSAFLLLPEDVLLMVLSYCDKSSLGRLSCVCKKIWGLVSEDSVWRKYSLKVTLIEDPNPRRRGGHGRNCTKPNLKEQCRLSHSWKKGIFQENTVLKFKIRQLPWMHRDNTHIWITQRNMIRCFSQRRNGVLHENKDKILTGHTDDVCRFVSRDNRVVSGGTDGRICVWSTNTGSGLYCISGAHDDEVSAIDTRGDLIVSGSRDSRLKIWSMSVEKGDMLRCNITAQERVWSVAISPDHRTFVSGTAGCGHVSPLRLWDMNTGHLSCLLHTNHRKGAGAKDVQFESPNELLSCGYDTYIRLWDTRTESCVAEWEEPYDSAIYCIRSDGYNSILAGTARYGMVRLWDKRMTKPVQMYYTSRDSSPVFSLLFDSKFMYVALDKSIKMLNFSLL
ncbi:F-box/WD repeat-containing protein 4 [Lingula anatina]|uniref:F-box/WD repeat-containing protein 4 n=1 Tax=Lingula anatina TaxID=7574 RepID=A0A1S3JJL5_LINAN|nr:F-box/WD repeat-containing protein 4 [Lingula anatina]|eukprot:XP_013410568.1 F-box/WD repeat-containing protein 4 [Lingula anatina]